jgi:hypothetical protein
MILASVAAVEPMAAAMQTTIWVDKGFPGDDELGSGSQANPYATISKAAYEASLLQGGTPVVIKVVEGDYTQAHESASSVTGSGYPIDVSRSNIRFEGADSDPEHYPRLGGDVNVSSSSVGAIFEVIATGSGRSGIDIKYCTFEEESITGRDAPSSPWQKWS